MAILPNTNLKVHEVRNILNKHGGKTNNDFGSLFRSTANINPFSKHKPVALDKLFCQDIDNTKPNYVQGWWKGTRLNCGLIPKQVSNFKNIPEAMDGEMNGWVYELPTGGENAPYRLGDFRGYDPYANPMLHNFAVPDTVSNQFSSSVVIGQCMMPLEGGTSLTFADFPIFKDYYLGMYLVPDTGTQYRYKTSEMTLGNGGSSVEISAYGLPTGNWTAYPFISESKQDGMTLVAGLYWTLPMNKPVRFKVLASLVEIGIVAVKGTLNTISVEVYVTSNGGPSSFTNNHIRIRYADKEFTDALVVGEISKEIGDITGVPTNGTRTLVHSDVYTVADTDVYNNCKVWISLSSANYLQGVIPIQDVTSPIE